MRATSTQLLWSAAVLVFAACGGKDAAAPPPPVAVGATVQLTATPKDAAGNVLTGRVVTWTTSNSAVATVSSTGLVTGVAPGGPVTITATSEGQSGTALIRVGCNCWTTVASMPTARRALAAEGVDGGLYWGGGRTGEGAP